MTAPLDALMLERLHDPTHHYTPEQAQHDRMQELIGLIVSALSEPTRRERGRPITVREAREARRLRHSGLTWPQVAERMGTTKDRAYAAGRKVIR